MSNPKWPGGPPWQQPGGGQEPVDPTPTPYPPSQGAPYPYQTPPQPPYPYGPPSEAGQQPNPYNPYNPYAPAADPGQSHYPYGQPAAPSQPMYPYGQPANPSQPMYPYTQGDAATQQSPFGYPAAPSQPMYPYGQPANPSQPMYPYGQFGPPSQGFPVPAARPRRSLKWLWITLAVVIVLLVGAGGGAVYVVGQLAAPATAAVQFCTDLKGQSYDAAYTMLSVPLQGQYTHEQFVQGSQALDQLDGPVTACQPATSGNSYHYSFGATVATVGATIARGKTSSGLTGTLHLKNENGAWKVDGIDTSLLGVNLSALQAATSFCAALQSKDYTTAASLLGSELQGQVAKADWDTWDQIGGTISLCNLQSLGSGNSDSAASMAVSVTRAKSGNKTGSLALALEGGAWKVSQIDAGLLGDDLAPLKVATRFCGDFVSGKWSDAYKLLSSDLQAQHSEVNFEQTFALPAGAKYVSCAPQYTTYKVTGGNAAITMTMNITDAGANLTATFKLDFQQNGTDWKVIGALLT
ncbi:MAG: hypothetical protein ACHQ4H_04440 [Ktedonobacterales bacterium]